MGLMLSVNAATAASTTTTTTSGNRKNTRDVTSAAATASISQLSSGHDSDGHASELQPLQPTSQVSQKTSKMSQVSQVSQKDKEPEISQCGLYAEAAEWEEYERPPRIKKTLLTAEEQAKFRGHLEKIFSEETLFGKRIVFHPDDVMQVLRKVMPYLESEPMLIEDVPFGVTIVGDLHGQLHDLDRVFKHDAKDGKPGWENMKYLFMGDYVDRGRQALELVMALFCIKCLYPDRIFLLRGNHEFLLTNVKYGVVEDIGDRYEDEDIGHTLYYQMNETFCWLSVAAIVGNQYFCAHAGISPAGFTRRQMRGKLKPVLYSNEDVLIHDMVWSDPARGLKGSSFNAERYSSIYYGLDTLSHALYSMECLVLFRGHTMLDTGYEIINHMCISLFTATGTSGTNDGAVAVIDEKGKMKIIVLECDAQRVAWDRMLKKLDRASLMVNKPEVEEKTKEDPDEKTIFDDDPGAGKISTINS